MAQRRELPRDWPGLARELGLRVRQFREAYETPDGRLLTQEDLAHRAGLSRNHIQNIENARNNARDASGKPAPGPGNPGLATLLAIARALNVQLLDLLPDQLLPEDIRDRPWPEGDAQPAEMDSA
ncbi:helix-turn-helix transcriptional regulator [Jiangella asiatica]|uniref:XRE family transcriptional regulator n=1 Tax=Jiangella asiatica TaxID=2530372 RepID=A0A4R5DCC1_9ACTN|nr:helix-turn-helix transcriptional regulator [Jiangella asiatica]TDE10607.1 XRE family transcriptional regulator [Jiangella asiatica]